MSKKSPFDITASALKIMGKKISAAKAIAQKTECVFIPRGDTHAIAMDGYVLAVLDLNKLGNFTRPGVIEELAFYADMQVIEFSDGKAMITAEKKEDFLMSVDNDLKAANGIYEDTELGYPDWKYLLPPAESLLHASITGAIFDPGKIGVLDKVAEAFDVMPVGDITIASHFYGAEADGVHICVLSGLLLAAAPLKPNKEEIQIVPSKSTIQSFFNPTLYEQTEMNFDEGE